MSAVFTASWDGICSNCDLGVNRGEQAMYENGELIHAGCKGVFDGNGKPNTCPVCNYVLPRSGICGNC